jgi:putative flippase GtrA
MAQLSWIIRNQKWINKHQIKLKFLFAGGVNTIFGLAAYPALYYFLKDYHFHYLFILLLTQIMSVLFSYMTSKFLVFKTKGNYLPEFLKFSTFYSAYFLLNLIILPLAVEVFNINPVISQTAFAFLIIITSYFWHSQITFVKK